jgi:hypothetical protein
MSEFLNNQELHTLTGYARPITQANWLKERGIVHKLIDRRVKPFRYVTRYRSTI